MGAVFSWGRGGGGADSGTNSKLSSCNFGKWRLQQELYSGLGVDIDRVS